jgi:hypothetical protein
MSGATLPIPHMTSWHGLGKYVSYINKHITFEVKTASTKR